MRRFPLIAILLLGLTVVPTLAGATRGTPVTTHDSPGATADECLVGRQDDGAVVLPTNQVLTPAGQQVEFLGRPNAVALRPDGQTAAFLTTEDPEPITVVDLATGAVVQEFSPDDDLTDETEPGASFAGIVYAADGSQLYAADAGGAITISDVADDGALSLAARILTPGSGEVETARPGGLALSDDGAMLYAALNVNNTLGVIDLADERLSAEIPVGNAPFGVVVTADTAYVSNQGGRPADDVDVTNNSAGTDIVADPGMGNPSTGTISVVDLLAGEEVATIAVGLQPTAMLFHEPYLFVANTNSDSVSVIDTTTDQVVKNIQVQVFPGAPWGSSPNGLAMLDDERLAVSLGRNNAVAVYDWDGPAEVVSFEGLIPTGWYPADLAVDTDGGRLIVANAKGVGSLGPATEAGPEAENPTGQYVHSNLGSTSIIPFPDAAEIAEQTAAVYLSNQWTASRCSELDRGTGAGSADAAPVAIPQRIGDPSTIKHVFYIIKENRTYDQVFGDMPQGNGDPTLTQFGAEVTPNLHALAEEFQLFDNLYVSGSLSADGHQWVTQAYVTDYVEKAFGDWSRSYPFNGTDALAYAPSGFLWENVLAHDMAVRVYGEFANQFLEGGDLFGGNFGDWADWYHDARVLAGEQSGDLNFPLGDLQTRTDVPSLDPLLNRNYPPYSMQIPDQYRAEIFLDEFAEYEANGNLPNLVTLLLPADHTAGTTPGMPTPRAMVADNDLAVGRIVEAITTSHYWADSAIFVIEDDAQNGVDHVDGHRTTGLILSPYAKRGVVDSTYYTQIDFVRTIEQILGIPPMNQMDMAATPMWDVFTDEPDLTPFTVLANEIPLDELNPEESALSGLELAWAETSLAMGFATYADIATGPDAKDENVLNRAIWYGSMGFDVPYPGDSRVLWPHEVEPALDDDLEEAEEAAERQLGGS